MTYRSKAFRDLVTHYCCACCHVHDGTIIPAHRNGGGRKGMGIKSPDSWVIPLCAGCHTDYDSGHWGPDADRLWLDMYADHVDALLTEGRLAIVGHNPREPKYKPIPKILPRAA